MAKLPRGLSGSQVIKVLKKDGFYIRSQKGAHVVMRRDSPYALVVVPKHRNVDTGTLDVILEGAGLSVDEFVALLR